MHNLFLGTAKHIMKNIWLDDMEPIIPKRFHVMISMQEKVDKCESPSSMGRIPHKIASSCIQFFYSRPMENMDNGFFYVCPSWHPRAGAS